MHLTEIKEQIEKMLEEAEKDTKRPYMDDYEQGLAYGKVEGLEDVLELFGIIK